MSISKIMIIITILLAFTQSASAGNWMRNGIWVSNICTNNHGAWFRFNNSYGVVGSNCTWIINGLEFHGRFGG